MLIVRTVTNIRIPCNEIIFNKILLVCHVCFNIDIVSERSTLYESSCNVKPHAH